MLGQPLLEHLAQGALGLFYTRARRAPGEVFAHGRVLAERERSALVSEHHVPDVGAVHRLVGVFAEPAAQRGARA